MPTKLYFAQIEATPEPNRAYPFYWDADSAIFELYFYADSVDDATAQAKAFLSIARWQVRSIVKLRPEREDAPENDPVVAELIAEAKQAGIAWRVIRVAPGGDPKCQPLELGEAAP